MDIWAEKLLQLLSKNTKPIQLRSGRNMVRLLSPAEALKRARTGRYIGVGSPRRVRYLRYFEQAAPVRPLAPSSFIRRVRNDSGMLIAGPITVEHKPLWK